MVFYLSYCEEERGKVFSSLEKDAITPSFSGIPPEYTDESALPRKSGENSSWKWFPCSENPAQTAVSISNQSPKLKDCFPS